MDVTLARGAMRRRVFVELQADLVYGVGPWHFVCADPAVEGDTECYGWRKSRSGAIEAVVSHLVSQGWDGPAVSTALGMAPSGPGGAL